MAESALEPPVQSGPSPPTAATSASPDELSRIYDEHSRLIYYLTLRFLGDRTQAEDATHDVFVKAFRKLDDFKGRCSLRTWLYRIAINHCRNLLQSWSHRNVHACPDEVLLEKAPLQGSTPLQVLEVKELGEQIQRTLDALPQEYRLLLLLVADQDLAYEEIATLTGQTADAVRGKLHRARKMFTALFNQHH